MDRELGRAEALVDLGRHREAEQIVRHHLAGNAESGYALRLLTSVLLHQDRDQEAVESGRRAVAADPAEANAHVLLASALSALGRQEEAVRVAREATRLAPSDWSTHYTLGMALRSGRRPRSREALDSANEAVRLAPYESHAHNLAGLCLDDLNLVAESERAFREALRLDPENGTAMNNLAGSAIDGGRLSDAGQMLTSALSIDAQRPMLHQNYDVLLLRLVRRLWLALAALGVLLAGLAGGRAPYPVRVATVVALLGLYAVATRRVTRHLPRGAHLWARGLFTRIPWPQRALVAGFVALSAGVVVIGLAPRSMALGTGLVILWILRLLGLAVIAGGLVGLVRGAFRRG
ncbi:MAG: tetratricopeptide repeat protein [Nocardioidaceae bacterium]|nr:tetratricopeptide repeat protein [Nocardioidaceae bacterium]